MYLPSEPADMGIQSRSWPAPETAGVDLDVPQDRLVQPSQLWSAISQLVAGGVPLVLRLVPRHPPNGPWDLAGTGAGPAGLWGARVRPSGELADANE